MTYSRWKKMRHLIVQMLTSQTPSQIPINDQFLKRSKWKKVFTCLPHCFQGRVTTIETIFNIESIKIYELVEAFQAYEIHHIFSNRQKAATNKGKNITFKTTKNKSSKEKFVSSSDKISNVDEELMDFLAKKFTKFFMIINKIPKSSRKESSSRRDLRYDKRLMTLLMKKRNIKVKTLLS